MDSAPYICVMCFRTGAPWSEDELGKTNFASFMRDRFRSGSECVPSEIQDAEFCCAFPTRNGSNSMLKGPDAGTSMIGCEKISREGGRVTMAVRGLTAPKEWTNEKREVYIPFSVRPGANFWFLLPTMTPIQIPAHLSNGRKSLYRQRPYDMRDFLGDAIRRTIVSIPSKWQHEDKGGGPFKKLASMLGTPELNSEATPSTCCLPTGGYPVLAPGDVKHRGCTCCFKSSFAQHLSVDCKGLGGSHVANTTWFNSEDECFSGVAARGQAQDVL